MVRFSVFGVPVRVQPAFFLMAAVLGVGLAGNPTLLLAWLAVVFTGVLAHELGHAAAFRAFGHPCSIELHAFGGHTSSHRRGGLSAGQDVAVSFAGPGTGLAIGAVAGALRVEPGYGPFAANVLFLVEQVNWYWGLLNLLPILPLDGGQILRAALARFLGRRADLAAHGASLAVAAAMLAVALYYGRPWGAMLCALFGWNNLQQLRALGAAGPDRGLRQRLAQGFRLLDAGDPAGAEGIAREARERAQRDATRREALRLLVTARLVSRDATGALRALESDPELAREEPLLQGLALQAAGRHAEAVASLKRAFDAAPSGLSGSALVRAVTRSGDAAGAESLALDSRASVLDNPSLEELETALLEQGRPAAALVVSERRFQRSRAPEAAFNAARACALLEDPDRAVAWLRRAIDKGLRDVSRRLESMDLNALAGRPDFEALRRS